jgi:hypothetical protein
MAIFSLHHATVGRSTHRAGTAGAHAAYVLRATAASIVIGEHMPTRRAAARRWLDEQEQGDRKNARVIDKLMLALPLELTPEEHQDLVRAFVAELGRGRVPWLAAMHDRGRDRRNPHAHVIIRDRDRLTGKRVAGLSERGSTDRARAVWEQCVNRALEAQGRPERVSRLSLAAQGIQRPPERHRSPLERGGRTYGFSPLRSENPRAPEASSEHHEGPIRPSSKPVIRHQFSRNF